MLAACQSALGKKNKEKHLATFEDEVSHLDETTCLRRRTHMMVCRATCE
jgi:hypothetical protein